MSGSGSPACDVVLAALRWDDSTWRIDGAAAEVVFSVGADAEVGGVAIEAYLAAGLDGVPAVGEGEVQLALEEIAVGRTSPSRQRC